MYKYIDTKSVFDSDGFLTDYTLYYSPYYDVWFCIFGDSDIYDVDIGYADATFDSEEEAMEWFESYEGIA